MGPASARLTAPRGQESRTGRAGNRRTCGLLCAVAI